MARILIIEDDELLLDVLTKSLLAAGHFPVTATDGRHGLKLFREEPADLVIADIVLPDQDGIGVLLALREEFPGTPVIAISGGMTRSPFYLDMARKLGARQTLAKPFKPEDLFQAIEAVLSENRSNPT